jgi:protein-tyrosine phosphatase
MITRLSAGQIIELPTETGPVLGAVATPGAILRLKASTGRLAIVPPHPFAIFGWLPHLRGPGKRLIEKYWPGPLTLVFPGGHESGILANLPTEVRDAVLRGNELALRLPDHEWVAEVVPYLPGPLVVTEHAVAQCDWAVRGEPRFDSPATAVRIRARAADLLFEGVISGEEIREACLARVLFVCTGNTCRSPMTAALCRKLLADHYACAPTELAAHGFRVESAGLAASLGGAASPEAVRVVAEWGGELGDHCSQPVTQELVTRADRIYTMTQTHERWLRSALPHLPVEMLAPGRDIADPIGGDATVYRECAQQILFELRSRLPEILEL